MPRAVTAPRCRPMGLSVPCQSPAPILYLLTTPITSGRLTRAADPQRRPARCAPWKGLPMPILPPPPAGGAPPGLRHRAAAWLAAVPGRDAIQRQQALLLQVLLLLLLGT